MQNSGAGSYSVKMRASRAGSHVSGAERIVPAASVPAVASVLAERALSHSKGRPDFLNIKVESLPPDVLRLKALTVATHVTHTAEEGRALAAKLLADEGIARVGEIMSLFPETHSMRPPSSTMARLVLRLYIFFAQFSIVE